MQIGVSNPNVPIFPPRVCTLVLFIIIGSVNITVRQYNKVVYFVYYVFLLPSATGSVSSPVTEC